jgi:hypothetical protein
MLTSTSQMFPILSYKLSKCLPFPPTPLGNVTVLHASSHSFHLQCICFVTPPPLHTHPFTQAYAHHRRHLCTQSPLSARPQHARWGACWSSTLEAFSGMCALSVIMTKCLMVLRRGLSCWIISRKLRSKNRTRSSAWFAM